MEEDQNNFEQVLSRILTKSPCSVVLSSGTDPDEFLDLFISAYNETLIKASLLPIRVKCAHFSDSISIWKEIAMKVKTAMPSVFEGNVITGKLFLGIERATTTESIKSYLIRILEQIFKGSGWMMLLILEDFENVVDKMEEHDLMKIRGMTTSFVIMTVSYMELKKLVDDKYEHAYFCNQFVTYKFV